MRPRPTARPHHAVRFPPVADSGPCQADGMATPDPDALHAERHRIAASRDARFDGQFVTAVHSTGIYCRPSCPARTPRSTTPSAMSRMARAAASSRRFHSGLPGVASGRQRRQARKPARCAAALVR